MRRSIMAGSSEERFDHPAQKPVILYDMHIANHRGDVHDPFAGAGTSLIAAEQQGRHCFAIEIEPRDVQLVIERWSAFTGQEAVRG